MIKELREGEREKEKGRRREKERIVEILMAQPYIHGGHEEIYTKWIMGQRRGRTSPVFRYLERGGFTRAFCARGDWKEEEEGAPRL